MTMWVKDENGTRQTLDVAFTPRLTEYEVEQDVSTCILAEKNAEVIGRLMAHLVEYHIVSLDMACNITHQWGLEFVK